MAETSNSISTRLAELARSVQGHPISKRIHSFRDPRGREKGEGEYHTSQRLRHFVQDNYLALSSDPTIDTIDIFTDVNSTRVITELEDVYLTQLFKSERWIIGWLIGVQRALLSFATIEHFEALIKLLPYTRQIDEDDNGPLHTSPNSQRFLFYDAICRYINPLNQPPVKQTPLNKKGSKGDQIPSLQPLEQLEQLEERIEAQQKSPSDDESTLQQVTQTSSQDSETKTPQTTPTATTPPTSDPETTATATATPIQTDPATKPKPTNQATGHGRKKDPSPLQPPSDIESLFPELNPSLLPQFTPPSKSKPRKIKDNQPLRFADFAPDFHWFRYALSLYSPTSNQEYRDMLFKSIQMRIDSCSSSPSQTPQTTPPSTASDLTAQITSSQTTTSQITHAHDSSSATKPSSKRSNNPSNPPQNKIDLMPASQTTSTPNKTTSIPTPPPQLAPFSPSLLLQNRLVNSYDEYLYYTSLPSSTKNNNNNKNKNKKNKNNNHSTHNFSQHPLFLQFPDFSSTPHPFFPVNEKSMTNTRITKTLDYQCYFLVAFLIGPNLPRLINSMRTTCSELRNTQFYPQQCFPTLQHHTSSRQSFKPRNHNDNQVIAIDEQIKLVTTKLRGLFQRITSVLYPDESYVCPELVFPLVRYHLQLVEIRLACALYQCTPPRQKVAKRLLPIPSGMVLSPPKPAQYAIGDAVLWFFFAHSTKNGQFTGTWENDFFTYQRDDLSFLVQLLAALSHPLPPGQTTQTQLSNSTTPNTNTSSTLSQTQHQLAHLPITDQLPPHPTQSTTTLSQNKQPAPSFPQPHFPPAPPTYTFPSTDSIYSEFFFKHHIYTFYTVSSQLCCVCTYSPLVSLEYHSNLESVASHRKFRALYLTTFINLAYNQYSTHNTTLYQFLFNHFVAADDGFDADRIDEQRQCECLLHFLLLGPFMFLTDLQLIQKHIILCAHASFLNVSSPPGEFFFTTPQHRAEMSKNPDRDEDDDEGLYYAFLQSDRILLPIRTAIYAWLMVKSGLLRHFPHLPLGEAPCNMFVQSFFLTKFYCRRRLIQFSTPTVDYVDQFKETTNYSQFRAFGVQNQLNLLENPLIPLLHHNRNHNRNNTHNDVNKTKNATDLNPGDDSDEDSDPLSKLRFETIVVDTDGNILYLDLYNPESPTPKRKHDQSSESFDNESSNSHHHLASKTSPEYFNDISPFNSANRHPDWRGLVVLSLTEPFSHPTTYDLFHHTKHLPPIVSDQARQQIPVDGVYDYCEYRDSLLGWLKYKWEVHPENAAWDGVEDYWEDETKVEFLFQVILTDQVLYNHITFGQDIELYQFRQDLLSDYPVKPHLKRQIIWEQSFPHRFENPNNRAEIALISSESNQKLLKSPHIMRLQRKYKQYLRDLEQLEDDIVAEHLKHVLSTAIHGGLMDPDAPAQSTIVAAKVSTTVPPDTSPSQKESTDSVQTVCSAVSALTDDHDLFNAAAGSDVVSVDGLKHPSPSKTCDSEKKSPSQPILPDQPLIEMEKRERTLEEPPTSFVSYPFPSPTPRPEGLPANYQFSMPKLQPNYEFNLGHKSSIAKKRWKPRHRRKKGLLGDKYDQNDQYDENGDIPQQQQQQQQQQQRSTHPSNPSNVYDSPHAAITQYHREFSSWCIEMLLVCSLNIQPFLYIFSHTQRVEHEQPQSKTPPITFSTVLDILSYSDTHVRIDNNNNNNNPWNPLHSKKKLENTNQLGKPSSPPLPDSQSLETSAFANPESAAELLCESSRRPPISPNSPTPTSPTPASPTPNIIRRATKSKSKPLHPDLAEKTLTYFLSSPSQHWLPSVVEMEPFERNWSQDYYRSCTAWYMIDSLLFHNSSLTLNTFHTLFSMINPDISVDEADNCLVAPLALDEAQ